ncbi:hypothetical protein [Nonomuraea ceibae]|uniref:hypothetical protein n=1 Tax=Nonomuraea ceibae TaxID=1935170 RepID=UPI001C5CE1CD|nr:hypothetical protein [Nonomuraea ceibae]
MRGYLDPDREEFPAWVLAELAELYHAGACEFCLGPLTGSGLADHFLNRKQEEYERSIPVWACKCGWAFNVLPEPRGEAYFAARADRLLGDLIGYIRLDPPGRRSSTPTPAPAVSARSPTPSPNSSTLSRHCSDSTA